MQDRSTGPGATAAPAVIVTTDAALRAIVADAVTEALADLSPSQPEGLIDRQELARRLAISTRGLDRLRREGMPEVRVGDVPRWIWPAVVAWLEGRGAS